MFSHNWDADLERTVLGIVVAYLDRDPGRAEQLARLHPPEAVAFGMWQLFMESQVPGPRGSWEGVRRALVERAREMAGQQ